MNEPIDSPADPKPGEPVPNPAKAASLVDPDGAPPRVGYRGFRLARLAVKELRETLRDRRTIVTLVLMPLLVYPILSLVFRTFLFSTADALSNEKFIKYRILVEGDSDESEMRNLLNQVVSILATREQLEKRRAGSNQSGAEQERNNNERNNNEQANASEPGTDQAPAGVEVHQPVVAPLGEHAWTYKPKNADQSLDDYIRNGEVDIGLRMKLKPKRRFRLFRCEVVYHEDNPDSKAAAEFLAEKFALVNTHSLQTRLLVSNAPAHLAIDMAESGITGGEQSGSRISLAALVPLILVLMTITGAVYPAIDLTAGERERGTLETLMAAPVPRVGILLSKFIAVLVVAVLTATLNIVGMLATIWAFQLESLLGGASGFTFSVVAKIFGLLILFASFYSALLLAVTSYARSFKEAQAYLIPIILLSMAPGLVAMTPGLSLAGPLAVAPMVNILLLARDVLQDNVLVVPALIAIASTVLYAVFAIMLAARIFGTDAILYGSQASWREMFTRPRTTSSIAPGLAVLFCLVLLLPMNFLLIGLLSRVEAAVAARLALMALFTFLSFVLLPWFVAVHQRVKTTTGFGIKAARPVYFLAAVLLGISLWPIVMSMISGWHDLYGMLAGSAKSQAWHDRLVKFSTEQAVRLREVSPVTIAICLSFVPAVCEEWFFRGFLLRSLLKHRAAITAIVTSAAVFGLFHVLSNSVVALDRLVPTTLIGLVLGYISYKSGSILPCVVLHMLHNGIVAFLAYYQPQLSQLSWFPAQSDPIPFWWAAAALIPCGLGMALAYRAKPARLEHS